MYQNQRIGINIDHFALAPSSPCNPSGPQIDGIIWVGGALKDAFLHMPRLLYLAKKTIELDTHPSASFPSAAPAAPPFSAAFSFLSFDAQPPILAELQQYSSSQQQRLL